MIKVHCDKCERQIVEVPTDKTKVEHDGNDNRKSYITVFFGRLTIHPCIEQVPHRGMRVYCLECDQKYHDTLREF